MRGALWRVANEQMRPATDDESRGIEMVNQFLDSMRIDLQKVRGTKRYLDVTREGDPNFPEDELPEAAISDEEDMHDDEADDRTRTPGSRASRLEAVEPRAPDFSSDSFRG